MCPPNNRSIVKRSQKHYRDISHAFDMTIYVTIFFYFLGNRVNSFL